MLAAALGLAEAGALDAAAEAGALADVEAGLAAALEAAGAATEGAAELAAGAAPPPPQAASRKTPMTAVPRLVRRFVFTLFFLCSRLLGTFYAREASIRHIEDLQELPIASCQRDA